MTVDVTPSSLNRLDAERLAIDAVLEACLRGEPVSPAAFATLVGSDLPADLATIAHELQHFLTDEDIRSRDPQYADYWRARLLEMRARVRSV